MLVSPRLLKGYPVGSKKSAESQLTDDKELEAFAKAKDLSFTPKEKGNIAELLDKLEAKHPETRFSLGKSVEEIRKIIG